MTRSLVCFPWGIHYSNCMGFSLHTGSSFTCDACSLLKTAEEQKRSRVTICVSFLSESGDWRHALMFPDNRDDGWTKKKIENKTKKPSVCIRSHFGSVMQHCPSRGLPTSKCFLNKDTKPQLHLRQIARLFVDTLINVFCYWSFQTHEMKGCPYSLFA